MPPGAPGEASASIVVAGGASAGLFAAGVRLSVFSMPPGTRSTARRSAAAAGAAAADGPEPAADGSAAKSEKPAAAMAHPDRALLTPAQQMWVVYGVVASYALAYMMQVTEGSRVGIYSASRNTIQCLFILSWPTYDGYTNQSFQAPVLPYLVKSLGANNASYGIMQARGVG